MATTQQREHLAVLMDYLVKHEPQVHYAQERPMDAIHYNEKQLRTLFSHGGSIRMDCSEAVTALCKWAGLRDPNGRGYNGTGYTGTLLANLPHYTDPRKAKTGALVVFGNGNGHHVCMVRHPGPDPLLWSHGQERGPIQLRLSVEREYQTGRVVFLSIKNL